MNDVILVSITATFNEDMSEKELYEATNFAWPIDKKNVENNSIKYAFAVYKGIVKEVYTIKRWVPAIERIPTSRKINKDDPHIKNRFAFDGSIAYKIKEKIVGKKSFVRLYGPSGYGSFEEAKKFYNLEEDALLNDIKKIIGPSSLLNTEKEDLVKCRIGQGVFREGLIAYWKGCSVTGFQKIEILIASHIKPWSLSTDDERLDVYNGLLLLPNLDKLFDKGYISFDDNGKIVISNYLENYQILGVSENMKINIKDEHKKYLAIHRKKIYKHI